MILPMPLWFHGLLARLLERIMKVPLISIAQVKILSEDVAAPMPGVTELPEDLRPQQRFTLQQIRRGLPHPAGFACGTCAAAGSQPIF